MLLAFPIGLMLVTSLYLLVRPTRYTASAVFMVQGGHEAASGLGALAAQFGAATMIGDVSQSPEFYSDLMTSDALLRELVMIPVQLDSVSGDSTTMLDIYAGRGPRDGVAQEKAVEQLRNHLAVSVDPATGVLTVKVSTPYALVSAEVVRRALDILNRFNLEVRKSQAREERHFVEGRLDEARQALRDGEDSLQGFLERNREFRHSPSLTFEFDRLQRKLSIRQSLFVTLAQSYEEVRAREVRDTPVIAVIELPIVPPRADPSDWVLRNALAGLVGLVLGLFLAFFVEFVIRSAEEEPGVREAFRNASTTLSADIARVREVVRRPRMGRHDGE